MTRELLLVSVMAVVACVSLPPPLSRSQFDQFRPGETTIADAEARLGRTLTRSVDGQGVTILSWAGTNRETQQSQSIVLRFGPDGKMLAEGNVYSEMGWSR